MNNNYINVVYDIKSRPITNYPNQLIMYLINRYNIKQEAIILENGCGRGDFIQAFRRAGMICYATDIVECDNISLKDINFSDINLESGRLPYKDNYFDVVFTKSVLEHITNPDNFIKEIYRVLKKDGQLIIMTPDWKSTKNIFYDDHTHVHPYTENAVSDLLKIYDFREIQSEIFYQLPIVWKYSQLKWLCKMLQVLLGPVKKIHKNKLIRWSRELMILGYAKK